MGKGRRPAKDEPPAAAAAAGAFPSPFQDLARLVKQGRAARGAAAPKIAPAPVPVAPVPTPKPPGDDELLAASREGASRLSARDARVTIRRRPDLSSIDLARQAELVEMARGKGFDVSYEDHFVRGRASGVSFETLARLEDGGFAISAHLDLHGLCLEDARREVDAFLAEQHKKGRRCVLLVTGKGKNSRNGEGVLREHVPEWLARGPSARRVLAFVSARPCDGGVGALVVLMRANPSSKNPIRIERGGTGPLQP